MTVAEMAAGSVTERVTERRSAKRTFAVTVRPAESWDVVYPADPGRYKKMHDDQGIAFLPVEIFDKVAGKKRAYGQKPHDRYALEYEEGLSLPAAWQEFIEELREGPYREMLCRLAGVRDLELRFHWHWATRGESVSPHCDAKRKLGSHIFYLNTADEWDPAWGGETLVLDDGGKSFPRSSSPEFEEFASEVHAEARDNWSFIFTRRGNSWHGVREITCPEGHFRKVFIVVLDKPGFRRRLARTFGLGRSA